MAAVPTSAEVWARFDLGDEAVDRPLMRRALDRVAADDVTLTAYGWRVRIRPDLGDTRDTRAYWPKPDGRRDSGWWCACRHGRSNRPCSHVLAILLVKAGYGPEQARYELEDDTEEVEGGP